MDRGPPLQRINVEINCPLFRGGDASNAVYLNWNGSFCLQKNTYNVTHTNVKYNKLSKGKGNGNRRRGNRTTTVAVPSGDADDLMPIIEPTRSEDEDDSDDDDEDGNDGDYVDNDVVCKSASKKNRNEQITFYTNTWESPCEMLRSQHLQQIEQTKTDAKV